MSVRFNVNDAVLVRLRPKGREAIEKHFRELKLDPAEYMRAKAQWDGRLRMQIWEMMHHFGPDSWIGSDPPIETEVEFA